jgi:hypothetical protein
MLGVDGKDTLMFAGPVVNGNRRSVFETALKFFPNLPIIARSCPHFVQIRMQIQEGLQRILGQEADPGCQRQLDLSLGGRKDDEICQTGV